MKENKILSNSELMGITGGTSFIEEVPGLSNVDESIHRPVDRCLYGIFPEMFEK